jgi:CHAT domain-containing protein
MDAALLLEDGRLTAEDLLFGPVDGQPVSMPSRVLFSSCSSSGTVGVGRGEWLGLMAACLLRGAGHVIGTAWRILDHPATLRLEEELLDEVAGGADPASALRACQLRRLASWRASGHDFRAGPRLAVPDHLELPLIWAAFQWSGVAVPGATTTPATA